MLFSVTGGREHSLSTTQKGRAPPITRKGLSLLPGRPETSASPTWASAAVTGTFHTLLTVYLRLRRTLPDSADLPPGLYSSKMDPSYKTHSLSLSLSLSLRIIQLFNARLASLQNSVHPNVSDPNNKHLNSDKSRNHINLRNTHIYIIYIYEHYNKAALSQNINTSCFFKKTRGTDFICHHKRPPPVKAAISYDDTRDC